MTMPPRITADQARALAMLVRTIRPEWDVPGISAAIYAARDRGTAEQVIFAAVRLTRRGDLRTPAVLAEDGPHWIADRTEGLDSDRFARCPEPGHQSYPAWACGACRAEEIGTDEPRPVEQQADPETYRRGAELVRAALTPTPARAAASDRREDHR